jgi:hypothetical protein
MSALDLNAEQVALQAHPLCPAGKILNAIKLCRRSFDATPMYECELEKFLDDTAGTLGTSLLSCKQRDMHG